MAISLSPGREKQTLAIVFSKTRETKPDRSTYFTGWLGQDLPKRPRADCDEHLRAHHPSSPRLRHRCLRRLESRVRASQAGTVHGAWAAWAPAKAFYPWLMDLPQLTPEARQFIEDEAKRRLSAGTDAIGQGQAGLHHAMAANDPAALQAAASGLREGLQNIESGTAALRALKEGAAPRQIALAWFRGQRLEPVSAASDPGPFGWSWFHLIAMLFLGAFVLGTLLIRFRAHAADCGADSASGRTASRHGRCRRLCCRRLRRRSRLLQAR